MKTHGNTGNRSAQHGDEPATSHLHIRITPQKKAGYVKCAQREGMKLSAWVQATLDRNLAGRGLIE